MFWAASKQKANNFKKKFNFLNNRFISIHTVTGAGRVIVTITTEPLYIPHLWNILQATLDDHYRSNRNLEGLNSIFKEECRVKSNQFCARMEIEIFNCQPTIAKKSYLLYLIWLYQIILLNSLENQKHPSVFVEKFQKDYALQKLELLKWETKGELPLLQGIIKNLPVSKRD